MSKSRNRSAFGLPTGLGLASMHAGITLWYRFPLLAAACAANGKSDPELARMVSEKAAAAVEGALDAQVELMRIAADAATGRLKPADLISAPATITAAGLQPAFRRVRANSRRLHRRHSR
jgi:hypothetical protein